MEPTASHLTAFQPPVFFPRMFTNVPCRRSCQRKLRFSPYACASSDPRSARAAVLRAGVDCAVDDFITSGSNVAIGGLNCHAVAESLAVKCEAGALQDMAFIPTNSAARDAVDAFSLPTDTSLNHGSVDTFLACVSQLDSELNAALAVTDDGPHSGSSLRTERMAAEIATQTVVVVPEVDFDSTVSGILSFPVHVDGLFANRVLESLRTDALLGEVGVRGVTERADGSNVADILLRPASDISTIDDVLSDMQGVRAVGILPTSATITAVVAAETEAFDITSSLHGIAELLKSMEMSSDTSSSCLEESDRKKRKPLPKLTIAECAESLSQLGEHWSLSKDGRDYLEREFRFGSVRQAHAFIARIHRIARMTDSYPELDTVFSLEAIRHHTSDDSRVRSNTDSSFSSPFAIVVRHGCCQGLQQDSRSSFYARKSRDHKVGRRNCQAARRVLFYTDRLCDVRSASRI